MKKLESGRGRHRNCRHQFETIVSPYSGNEIAICVRCGKREVRECGAGGESRHDVGWGLGRFSPEK